MAGALCKERERAGEGVTCPCPPVCEAAEPGGNTYEGCGGTTYEGCGGCLLYTSPSPRDS